MKRGSNGVYWASPLRITTSFTRDALDLNNPGEDLLKLINARIEADMEEARKKMAQDDLSKRFVAVLKEHAQTYGEACRRVSGPLGKRLVKISANAVELAIRKEDARGFLKWIFSQCPPNTILMNCDGVVVRLLPSYSDATRSSYCDIYCLILANEEWEQTAPGAVYKELELNGPRYNFILGRADAPRFDYEDSNANLAELEARMRQDEADLRAYKATFENAIVETWVLPGSAIQAFQPSKIEFIDKAGGNLRLGLYNPKGMYEKHIYLSRKDFNEAKYQYLQTAEVDKWIAKKYPRIS